MRRYLVENLPSALFFGLLFAGVGLEQAGWSASIAAMIVLVAAWSGRVPWSPILLGINIHFAMAAPVLTLVDLVIGRQAASLLLPFAEPTVLVMIFAVSVILHGTHRGRFLGGSGSDAEVPRSASLVMLLISVIGIGWVFWPLGASSSGIAGPLALLFLAGFAILRSIDWLWSGLVVPSMGLIKAASMLET